MRPTRVAVMQPKGTAVPCPGLGHCYVMKGVACGYFCVSFAGPANRDGRYMNLPDGRVAMCLLGRVCRWLNMAWVGSTFTL